MKINSRLKLLYCIFLFGFHNAGYGQHLDEELKLKLSEMERKRIEKSDEQYSLGVKTEGDANNLLINESSKNNNDKLSVKKKYTSKQNKTEARKTIEYYSR